MDSQAIRDKMGLWGDGELAFCEGARHEICLKRQPLPNHSVIFFHIRAPLDNQNGFIRALIPNGNPQPPPVNRTCPLAVEPFIQAPPHHKYR